MVPTAGMTVGLKVELLAACDKHKPIIIINAGSQNDAPLPGFLPPDNPLIAFGAGPEAGFRALLAPVADTAGCCNAAHNGPGWNGFAAPRRRI